MSSPTTIRGAVCRGYSRGSLRTRWKRRENDERRESKRRGNGRTESEAQIPNSKSRAEARRHAPTRDTHAHARPALARSLSLPSLPFPLLGLIGLQPLVALSPSGHFPSQTRDEASTGAAPSERSSSFKLKLSLPVSFQPPGTTPADQGPSVDRRATGAAASQTPTGNLNLRLRGGSRETKRLEWNLIARKKDQRTRLVVAARCPAPCRGRGPCVA
ncbi:hypothetical protein B0T11DRAFT_8636 [Plectosphaerella cucumerina]|uniref:Uncharacterized protein n=1 Tax=Plectosphaerella cucumerina TaxID=40658 RepID=A0A8K0TUX0_9PEZI|nr:hypothetical protein B0T11DRAFT_8636 [Plectosphaerella cucumerina]